VAFKFDLRRPLLGADTYRMEGPRPPVRVFGAAHGLLLLRPGPPSGGRGTFVLGLREFQVFRRDLSIMLRTNQLQHISAELDAELCVILGAN